MERRGHISEAEATPWAGIAALTGLFAAMVAVRLTIPGHLFFDEIHYVPAARELLLLDHAVNAEHPMLGKQLIALGIAMLGDTPLGWRIMPAIFGVIALFASLMAMWEATRRRFATLACGVLLITGFPLLVHARIAMLDVFMAAFFLLALWPLAAAVRGTGNPRWMLALAGAALGCAMASKWTVLALVTLPGIAFALIRLWHAGPRFLTARDCGPVPGISLIEAAVWLGLLPLAVYFASFWPYLFYAQDPLGPTELFALQREMFDLQQLVVEPHPYQSNWPQWIANWRAIWYLYEVTDGAQRGVILIGNPVSMLAGLAGFAWCAWAGLARQRTDALALAVLYAVALGFWIVAAKPIQFYYHYFLPSCFLMACLALALDEAWRTGRRWLALAPLALTAGVFAYFWPILTAAELENEQAFTAWTWIDSWR